MSEIEHAGELRLSGQFDAAESICQRILAREPDTAAALSLLAACRAERGAVESAIAPMERARELAPEDPIVAMHASVVREASGDMDGALASAREASELGPGRFETWGRLGDLAGRMEEFDEAEIALSRCLQLNPGHLGVALRLAGARLVLADFDGATAALDHMGAAAESLEDALRMRIAIAHRHADWKQMQARAEQLLALAPGDEEALGGLAYALGQQGYYNKAARIFRPVVEASPRDARHWAALGRLRLGARDLDEARTCFERALELEPESADANLGMARLLTFTGDMTAAEEYCRRTLASDPENLEAYGQLCEVSSGRVADEELARLEAVLAGGERPADQQAIGLFALGDIHHARKQREAAFAAWTRANQAKLSLVSETRPGYDRSAQERGTNRLKTLFARPVEPATPYDGDVTPIFIVGMPRSGTTLLETAISAHSEVEASGELPALPFIVQDMLAWARESGWRGGALPGDRLERWRQQYLGQYASFAIPAARYVTDKQPANFFAIGLIAQLFPESPILHIRRNAVETGFSIFRRNFSAQWPFANDLGEIAHYYGQYARIMDHWDNALPGRTGFVQYESLVDSFEDELRRLLAHCGLPFEQACLDYHKVDRTVMTFSATQVRKAPTGSHKSGSAAYEDLLQPLRQALEAEGIDPQSGALANPGSQKAASSPVPDPAKPFWKRLFR